MDAGRLSSPSAASSSSGRPHNRPVTDALRNLLQSTSRPLADADRPDWAPVAAAANVVTSKTPPITMSFAVLALIIVASLCAVVGAIYLLIYFKSIKPMTARARSYKDAGGAKSDDDGSRSKSAHPFFRRK